MNKPDYLAAPSAAGVNTTILDVARKLDRDGDEHGVVEALREAAAATAELFEADKSYDAALDRLAELNRRIAENGWIEIEHDALRNAGMDVARAKERRRAALERLEHAP